MCVPILTLSTVELFCWLVNIRITFTLIYCMLVQLFTVFKTQYLVLVMTIIQYSRVCFYVWYLASVCSILLYASFCYTRIIFKFFYACIVVQSHSVICQYAAIPIGYIAEKCYPGYWSSWVS